MWTSPGIDIFAYRKSFAKTWRDDIPWKVFILGSETMHPINNMGAFLLLWIAMGEDKGRWSELCVFIF